MTDGVEVYEIAIFTVEIKEDDWAQGAEMGINSVLIQNEKDFDSMAWLIGSDKPVIIYRGSAVCSTCIS